MSTVGEMLVALGLNTGPFTAGMTKAKGELTGFAAEADRSGKKASGSFNAVGMASLAVVGGVAAIGVSAIKSASDFQASMTLVQTQAGASAAEVTKMSAAALALAPTVGMGPDQLAAGLYHIESAGLRGAKALEVLKIAAEGAKVGNADLESVTNALIAEVNSGVGGVKNMSQAMGVLNAIVGSGNMRMADLTDAMSTGVLSAAKTFGVSIQSVGAAIADMTNQGIPAVDAATKLNSALRLMAAPTKAAAKELATIGLSSTSLAKDLRSPGGILAAVTDLQAHMTKAGLTATQQAALLANAFGGKQSLGILTLVGSLGKLGTIQAQVTKGAGTFDAAWKATEATTKEQAAQVDASLSTVKDAIGIGLLPAVNGLLHSVLPMVQGFAMWAAANPDLTTKILLVTGAVAALVAGIAFLGPIIAGIGTAIGIITSPILLVIGAIVALAAHFGLFGKGAKDMADGLLGTIQRMVPQAISFLRGLADQILSWINSMVGPVLSQLGQWADAFVAWIGPMIPQVIGTLGDLASQAIAWIAAQAPVLLGMILSWVDSFVGWIGPMIPQVLGALGDFGGQVINWIIAEVPIVAVAIGKMAIEFINWVIPKIPGLLLELGKLGLALIGWVLEQVPKITGALLDWGGKLIGWVLDSIPGLLANLGNMLGQLLGWFTGVLGQIGDAAFKFGKAIFDGVINGIGDIAKAVGDKLNSIPGVSIIGGVVSFGVSVASNAVGGVNDLLTTAGGGGAALAQQHAAQSKGLPPIPVYANGGIVPGTGPMLAIIHGGETVIPAGTLEPKGGVTSQTSAPGIAAAAVSRVSALASNIRLQAAQDAVTAAQRRLVAVIHEHLTKTRTAADRAAQVATAHEKLRMAEERLTLVEDQIAASAAKSLASGSATGTRGAGAGATGNQGLTAALAAFTAALLRAVASGVPITLDYQSVGSMLDQGQYANAARVSSGFVTGGSPAG